MKGDNPFNVFMACFNSSFEIIVPTEELQRSMREVNSWLMTLNEVERDVVANKMASYIQKAQEVIRQKQEVLEDIILVNRGQMKANSQYGKY